jgi:hypothetical protein
MNRWWRQWPLVVKLNAMAGAPTAFTPSTSSCRHWSWTLVGHQLPIAVVA